MNVIDKFIGVIAPNQCIACGVEGASLCSSCLLAAGNPHAPRCAGCKVLSKDFLTCKSCRSWLPIKAVYVATEYDGLYERLVKSYKFDINRQAAKPISALMVAPLPIFDTDVTFCPLPTASARIRERGFDHAKLLAKELAKHYPTQRVWSGLRRRTNTRQLGSTRVQRMKQMQDEFYVDDALYLKGKTVLMIDDVVTTGASIAAAAKALKTAGAREVYAVVFAQKA